MMCVPIQAASMMQAPMQFQPMQMQFQTVQMPMQYVQVAMPMQSSQIIQTAPIQMQEQQVVYQRDDAEINCLQEEIKRLRVTLEEWRAKLLEYERRGPQIIEKIVERPIEVVKVDETRIRELESQLNDHRREKAKQGIQHNQNEGKLRELEEELRRARLSIEEWKSKVSFLEIQGPKIVEKRVEIPFEVVKFIEKRVEVPVEVIKKEVVVDDRRIRELEGELNFFREENRKIKISIEEWRSRVTFFENQGPKIVEKRVEVPFEVVKYVDKRVEVPVEVVKYVDRVVEKVVKDDRRIRELEGEVNFYKEENRKIKISIEEWRTRVTFFENQGPKIVEKRVEVPFEVVKYVDKRVEVPVEVVKYVEKVVTDDRRNKELEGELNFYREENRKIKISIEEWKSKVIFMEKQGPKIVEKRVEVPYEVVKYVDKRVEVPVEVIKYVDKRIEVPFEVVKYVDKVVEKVVFDDRRIRELEGELNFYKEENRKIKITIEEWRSKATFFENQGPKIVEKRVEVPYEVIKYVDRVIEKPFEVVKYVDKIIEKRVEVPVDIVRYVDKRVEVPVEVVKYVDKVVEKIVTDDRRIRELEFQYTQIIEENKRLKITLDEWRIKLAEFEEIRSHGERVKRSANQDKAYYEAEIVRLKKQIEEILGRGSQIVEKRIEVPVEIVKYVDKVVVDDRRVQELESQLRFIREENRRIQISIEEWRSKYTSLEMQGPRVVEKRIEVPVEVFREKVVVDDSKVAQLSYEIERLRQVIDLRQRELEEWKSKYSSLEIKITEFRGSETRLFEYENRIALLSSEIERLNGFIVKLKSDNQELSMRQSSMQDRGVYENKIASFATEIERLNTIIVELRNKEGRLYEYENRIAMMAAENERLSGLVRKLKSENEVFLVKFGGSDSRFVEMENKIALLTSEVERINLLNRQFRQENERVNVLLLEYQGYEVKIREYENRIALMASEIERLRRLR